MKMLIRNKYNMTVIEVIIIIIIICYEVNSPYSAVKAVKVCALVIRCAIIYSCTYMCAFVHLFMYIYD